MAYKTVYILTRKEAFAAVTVPCGLIKAGLSFCNCSGVETRTPLSRATIFATPGTRNSHQPNSVTTFHLVKPRLVQYTTCHNTDNKGISATLCSLSFLKQTKQTSKINMLLYVKIMPLTTTCKLHNFFVFIYKIKKKCLKCTFISTVAFLIMYKSIRNYNITNKYKDAMSQINFFSLQHLSAYIAIIR
jgi:hypothetical protein